MLSKYCTQYFSKFRKLGSGHSTGKFSFYSNPKEVKVLVAQSCLALCDPVDCSPPGSPSMEFSRYEYWSGLPFPPPGYLPDLVIKPMSLSSPALAGIFFTTVLWKPCTQRRVMPKNVQTTIQLCLFHRIAG